MSSHSHSKSHQSNGFKTPKWKDIARRILRPSFRLKTSLYVLSAGVMFFVLVALSIANRAVLPKLMPEVATIPSDLSPADVGTGHDIAMGKDAHLVDQDIQRSFEEPDYALLSGVQPHNIGCDVPLEGSDKGKLVFLGIFSHAAAKSRRDLYREIVIPDFPPDLFTIKFFLGTPPPLVNPTPEETKERKQVLEQVRKEIKSHDDMVILDMVDNIDLGKTHEYFKWVAKRYAGEGRVKDRPRFVMKADDDTLLVVPNLVSTLKDLDCSKNYYWGTTAGRSQHFGEYMRGLAYAMSWPLVSWIGNADMPYSHIVKIEDARTAQWLKSLDPLVDPIHRLDMGWMMGDWNQMDVFVETVALHWLKWDDWVREQYTRLKDTWEAAGREWIPENGVPTAEIVEKGKVQPEGAKRENERLKAEGYDVY